MGSIQTRTARETDRQMNERWLEYHFDRMLLTQTQTTLEPKIISILCVNRFRARSRLGTTTFKKLIIYVKRSWMNGPQLLSSILNSKKIYFFTFVIAFISVLGWKFISKFSSQCVCYCSHRCRSEAQNKETSEKLFKIILFSFGRWLMPAKCRTADWIECLWQ